MSKQITLAIMLLALAAPSARAGGYLTPFIGAAFSGNTDNSKLTYGGDLAFAGSGLVGVSLDFGYTREFFGSAATLDHNNVTTLMGNVMLISPGHPRLYASGGVGLLKTRVRDASGFFDIDSTDLGLNVGGGIYIIGSEPLGFRADIRYFRALKDPRADGGFDVNLANLNYWRATMGITVKF